MKHLLALISLLTFSYHALAQWSDHPSVNTWICDNESSQINQEVATDNSGGAFVVWKDGRSGTFHLYAQHVDDKGFLKWNESGVPVATATTNSDGQYIWDYKVLSDGDGGAIIVWSDERNHVVGNDFSGNIYAQRINSEGEVQWTVNGETICDAQGIQSKVDVMTDGAGGAFIVWEDKRSGEFNIYAQHINHSGEAQWEANGMPVSKDNVYSSTIPQLVPDGSGGLLVFWHQTVSIYERYFKAQHLSASGVPIWSDGGLRVITLGNNDQYLGPGISSDGAGGAILTWYESFMATIHKVLAQRISSTGSAMWPGRAIEVCENTLGRSIPEMTSDNNGGAIVIWEHGTHLGSKTIRGQRLNPSGQFLWPATGLPIITGSEEIYEYKLISDGADGTIVAAVNSKRVVLGQRVSGQGTVEWNNRGVRINSSDAEQGGMSITGNGNQEALIFWQDWTSQPYKKIYGRLTNSVLLPVTLVSFTATMEQNRVQLSWVTSAEVNNKGFEIERSADGKKFTKIGGVAASTEISAEKIYGFNDSQPFSGINYYRLKQLDHDGTFAYSKMVAVDAAVHGDLSVYPNPSNNIVNVKASGGEKLDIVNMLGITVMTLPTSSSYSSVNISSLKPGMYIIKTATSSKIFVKN